MVDNVFFNMKNIYSVAQQLPSIANKIQAKQVKSALMRKLFKIQAPPTAVSIDLHGEYSFKKHKLGKEKIYYFDRLGKIRVNNEGEQWKENWDVIGEWKADTTGIVDIVVLGETF